MENAENLILTQDKKDFLAKNDHVISTCESGKIMMKFSTFVKNETNKSLEQLSDKELIFNY